MPDTQPEAREAAFADWYQATPQDGDPETTHAAWDAAWAAGVAHERAAREQLQHDAVLRQAAAAVYAERQRILTEAAGLRRSFQGHAVNVVSFTALADLIRKEVSP